MNNTVELLAPVGTNDAFFAAVSAGANAVYMGLEMFNARRGAENFTLAEFESACNFAHLRGVLVYVTLNTIVLPEEVESALNMACDAYNAGADAFIVQDLGIASQLKNLLPNARLHMSTQANIHNAAGVEMAASLGAARVTLSRELSEEEITALAQFGKKLGIEVEVFVHGAICVCYSGQCLMSSMIGGRSANRGMCAQPCRLPYQLYKQGSNAPVKVDGEHILSPHDLCLIDNLGKLAAAGVASFKIEGRMKSPEYVFATVSTYKQMLNQALDNNSSSTTATKAQMDKLAQAFSRGFTTAYFEGKRGNEIMSYKRPNNRGILAGRVKEVKGKNVVLLQKTKLGCGDVIQFWTKKGQSTYNICGVKHNGKFTNIQLDKQVRSVYEGDRAFLVRSVANAFMHKQHEPRINVKGTIKLKIGEPLHIKFTLTNLDEEKLFAIVPGNESAHTSFCGEYSGSIVEAARSVAVSESNVHEHINRMGQTPFQLESLSVDLDAGVGIGFSALHAARTKALENLQDNMLAHWHARKQQNTRHSTTKIVSSSQVANSLNKKPSSVEVSALVNSIECAKAAKQLGVNSIYVAAQAYLCDKQRYNNLNPHVILPTVNHANPAQLVMELSSTGAIVAQNFGDLALLKNNSNTFEVGPNIPATNALSLEKITNLRASRVWLSPELNLQQIEKLAENTNVKLGVCVLGTQQLMLCKHCVLMAAGSCNQQCATCKRRKDNYYLLDRKGYKFPVRTDATGLCHIYNSVQTNIVHSLDKLMKAGVTSFIVDGTLMSNQELKKALHQVFNAARNAQAGLRMPEKPVNTTTGHLFRGVV